MARVLTDNVQLNYVVETALGTPDTTGWKRSEPNSVSSFGASITKISRSPISQSRQRRKGVTVDLDSAVEFEHDLTQSAFEQFIEGFVFATAVNSDMDFEPSAAETTGDSFTVAALTAAQSAKLEFSASEYATLVYASGFSESANNGLHDVDADIATSATAISVTTNLTNESSPPETATLRLAGLRSLAASGDFTWAWDSGAKEATLTSAGDITDFTQFGLTVGQTVHIGSPNSVGSTIENAFENSAANDMFGYCRIKAFGTGTITFDKVDTALQFNDAVAPTTAVDILFGKFIRNRSVNDSDYLTRSFQFEMVWPDLDSVGTDEYSYAKGNYCNSLGFNLSLADKAVMTLGFVGTDTDNPTTTRKTGAASSTEPEFTAALNTTSDIARLRIQETDEDGITTDFKSLSITINNNVSPEKVIGTLGAAYMNTGNFDIDIEATLLFTDGAVINKIRDNETVTMDFIMKGDDGIIAVDIPSMTMGGGVPDLPVNESVTLSATAEAFEDDTLSTSIGISTIPVPLP